jgi:Histidine kinase/Two component regulator propeller
MRFKSTLYLLGVTIALFFHFRVTSQNLIYKAFTINEGLPSNQVYDVFQDKEGYLWMSSDAGVTRYDGKTFKTFTKSNGLQDNVIFQSIQDKLGRIWFRAYNGTICYYLQGKIYSLKTNQWIKKYIDKGITNSNGFLITDDGTVHLGMSDKNNTYIQLHPPYLNESDIEVKKFPNSTILDINEEYLFVGVTYSKEVSFKNNRFDSLPTIINTPSFQSAVNKSYLFFTRSNHLHSINLKTDSLQTLNLKFHLNNVCLYENQLFLPSNNGCHLYGMLNSELVLRRHLFDGIAIAHVFIDREGGYWFSTLFDGVLYVSNLELQKYQFADSQNINYKFESFNFFKNELYALTLNRNVVNLSKHQYVIRDSSNFYPYTKHKLKNSRNQFFLNDRMLDSVGVKRPILLKCRDGKSKKFYSSDCFDIDEKNQLFITRGQMNLKSSNRDILKNIQTLGYITCADYQAPYLILGMRMGIFLLKVDRNGIDSLHALDLGTRVNDVKIDGSEAYIASRDGNFLVYSMKEKRLLKKGFKLNDNICNTIFIDSKEKIFLGTQKGIQILNRQTWKIKTFDWLQAFIGNDIGQIMAYQGWLYCISNSQINKIPKSCFDEKAAQFNLAIKYFETDSNKYELLNNFPKEVEYKNQIIKIGFQCLSFYSAGYFEYAYKINNGKYNIISNNEISLLNLPSGHYKIEIIGRPSGSDWSQPKIITFEVLTPFWKTTWFSISMGLIISSLVLYGFYLFLQRKNNLKLKDKLIEQEIQSLKASALRAQMNPHFLFNVINSIQYYIINKEPVKAYQYLTDFSKLVRGVLNQSNNESITLKEEMELVELYIKLEQIRLSFKYDIIIQEDLDTVQFFTMLIQPFVENAIWHGLSETSIKDKYLEINIKGNKEMCLIQIIDNGLGIYHTHEKGKPEHVSFAMEGVKKRVEAINQLHQVRIDINIFDRSDLSGNKEVGTLVEIRQTKK